MSGSYDTTIKIWNPKNGALKGTINRHTGDVSSLTTLLNGDLVSGSGDYTIKIWNPSDGSLAHETSKLKELIWVAQTLPQCTLKY